MGAYSFISATYEGRMVSSTLPLGSHSELTIVLIVLDYLYALGESTRPGTSRSSSIVHPAGTQTRCSLQRRDHVTAFPPRLRGPTSSRRSITYLKWVWHLPCYHKSGLSGTTLPVTPPCHVIVSHITSNERAKTHLWLQHTAELSTQSSKTHRTIRTL